MDQEGRDAVDVSPVEIEAHHERAVSHHISCTKLRVLTVIRVSGGYQAGIKHPLASAFYRDDHPHLANLHLSSCQEFPLLATELSGETVSPLVDVGHGLQI